jgi:hypothetical protein
MIFFSILKWFFPNSAQTGGHSATGGVGLYEASLQDASRVIILFVRKIKKIMQAQLSCTAQLFGFSFGWAVRIAYLCANLSKRLFI